MTGEAPAQPLTIEAHNILLHSSVARGRGKGKAASPRETTKRCFGQEWPEPRFIPSRGLPAAAARSLALSPALAFLSPPTAAC